MHQNIRTHLSEQQDGQDCICLDGPDFFVLAPTKAKRILIQRVQENTHKEYSHISPVKGIICIMEDGLQMIFLSTHRQSEFKVLLSTKVLLQSKDKGDTHILTQQV